MNIYEKLQSCRVDLQNMNLKKSGENKFANYDYFELCDFLPYINELFKDYKLFSQISFTPELATLIVVDSEKPEDRITFTSPMAAATLKGCHDIQNLGAVESYQRRYLYLAALEIVESDALDKTTGKGTQGGAPKEDKPDKKDQLPWEEVMGEPNPIECADCKGAITQAEIDWCKNKPKYKGKYLCKACQKNYK